MLSHAAGAHPSARARPAVVAESLLVLLMSTLALGALYSERTLGLALAQIDACGTAHRFSLSSEPAGLELQQAHRCLEPMQSQVLRRPHETALWRFHAYFRLIEPQHLPCLGVVLSDKRVGSATPARATSEAALACVFLSLGWGTHTHSRWPGVGQLRDRRVRTTMSGLRHSCSGSILMVRLHLPEPAGLPSSVLGLLAPALGASLTASFACRETEHSAISQRSSPSLTALISPAAVLKAGGAPHSKAVQPASGMMWHPHERALHEEWS